jgi:hypothetical protein
MLWCWELGRVVGPISIVRDAWGQMGYAVRRPISSASFFPKCRSPDAQPTLSIARASRQSVLPRRGATAARPLLRLCRCIAQLGAREEAGGGGHLILRPAGTRFPDAAVLRLRAGRRRQPYIGRRWCVWVVPEHDLDVPHDTLENLHDQKLVKLVDLGDSERGLTLTTEGRDLLDSHSLD